MRQGSILRLHKEKKTTNFKNIIARSVEAIKNELFSRRFTSFNQSFNSNEILLLQQYDFKISEIFTYILDTKFFRKPVVSTPLISITFNGSQKCANICLDAKTKMFVNQIESEWHHNKSYDSENIKNTGEKKENQKKSVRKC